MKKTVKKGRPVNPTSKRQLRLKELAEKRANGELKKGRPINAESKRQKRLAELAAKAKANGGKVKRGRNIDPTSARQQRLAEKAALKAAGIEVKKGRPKTKIENAEIVLDENDNAVEIVMS